jgi:glycosyltransferase involved in cell wall biosynthesis
MANSLVNAKLEKFDGQVAVIAHSHPSVTKGGAEIAAYTLYKGYLSLGVDAIFVAACPERDRAKLGLDSSREHAIFYRPERYDHFYQLGAPDSRDELNQILRSHQTTVANFHHFLNFGLGALRDVKMGGPFRKVLTFHEFLAICHNHGQMITRPGQLLCERESPSACTSCFPDLTRQQFSLRKDLFLETLKGFDGFVSPSEFLARRFVDWGLPHERMAVIENGLAHIPPRRIAQPDAHKSSWTFGFFGQVNPFKGLDTLLAAAEVLAKDQRSTEQIRIRIHGNMIGLSDQFLKRFTTAQERQIIDYAGPYNNSSVGQLMADCDYLLVPSRWWENSPVVIQEAYAVGRPVICSGIGGMAEKVINGVTGLHFRVGDHLDLVRVMRSAAQCDMFTKLQAGIPAPIDGAEMARRYLAFFEAGL